MPQFPEHDCRQQQDLANMSIRTQKKAAASAVKASYMLPTKSIKRRQLDVQRPPLHRRSRPLNRSGAPVLRATHAQSPTREAAVSRGERRVMTSTMKAQSTLKSTGSSSTLLFPKTHVPRALRSSVNIESLDQKAICETEGSKSVLQTTSDNSDLEFIEDKGYMNSREEDDCDLLLGEMLSDNDHISPKQSSSFPKVPSSDHDPEITPHITAVSDNNETHKTDVFCRSTSSSTAQLVRQCMHCKVLYHTAHTCEKKGTNAMTRPQTAPSGYHALRSSLVQQTRAWSSRPGSGRRNVTRPLSSTRSQQQHLSHSPFQQTQRPSSAYVPKSIANITDSFARSSRNSSGGATASNYNYNAISLKRRPKSSSSLWKHRPPPCPSL